MSIEPDKGFHFEFSYPGYLQRSRGINVISLREDVMNLTAVSRRPTGLTREEPRIPEVPVAEPTGSEALRLAGYAWEKTGQLLNGFSLAGVMVLSILAAFPGSATLLFPGSPRQGR
ncbi:MAG: hypothetical protein IH955_10300 [Chloroflexi bacterium]|nr:hypothetical protein [Chloroflexota bacterium]